MTAVLRAIRGFIQRLRLVRIIAAAFVLATVTPFVVVQIGHGPTLEQIEAFRHALDSGSSLLTILRNVVFLVLSWYGPVWFGVRGKDLGRTRIAMIVVAVAVELALVRRLLVF